MDKTAKLEAFVKFVEECLVDEDFEKLAFTEFNGRSLTAQYKLLHNVNGYTCISYHLVGLGRGRGCKTKLTTVASNSKKSSRFETVVNCSLKQFLENEKFWYRLLNQFLEDTVPIWYKQ